MGADSALSLGHLCQRQGITKPLLVTDAGLIEVGIIGPIAAAMTEQLGDFPVFSGVTADPA